MCRLLLWLGLVIHFFRTAVVCGAALTYEDLKPLGDDDFDAKAEAISKVRLSGGPAALRLLQALRSESVVVNSSGKILMQDGNSFLDPITGAAITVSPDDVQSITINNLLRSQISESVNALQLQAQDPATRARAIDGILREPDPSLKPDIDAARVKEKDPVLKGKLDQLWALTGLQDPEAQERLKAAKLIGDLRDPQLEGLLLPLTLKKADGSYNEPDPKVRTAVLSALQQCRFEERKIQLVGTVFAGLSLGSILVLAALGLAITYGLIGVINMAHGEFLMVGAYATYVTQEIFKAHFTGALDWYPIAAVPVSFFAAAISGVVLERCVLRFLYGRPLETLLTTFGVSLVIIQAVRTLFGAQNVQVSNPSWMSGGITVMPHLILPFNRIVIIGFALCVVGIAGFVLNRTRLGLFVRAVTQNRRMAA
ncbi:MAG: urea ABC transporter permease subunit UrtB, partial [Verrucomicrobia bacterium]|nr:urea ABC transporter permease subunit UrtB [Verrucomicrobiota bacterium]